MKIAIFGCGALGSRIASDLALPGRTFLLWDQDKVSKENLGTSVYTYPDIGLWKVKALASILYTRNKCRCDGINHQFPSPMISMMQGVDLIVDCFDNRIARNATFELQPVVHVGLSDDAGEVVWNPSEYKYKGVPICTHQLYLPLIAMTACAGVVAIERFIRDKVRVSYLVTSDGSVRKF